MITSLGGALMGLVLAAIHPDRLRALVFVDGWARARTDVDTSSASRMTRSPGVSSSRERDDRERPERHDVLLRSSIERAGGHILKTTGDGVLATLDGPGRALAAAQQIRGEASRLGLDVRVGLHVGEVEFTGTDVVGMAVHVAARVASLARADEVLVSSTVRDLVVGSRIDFADRGSKTLKGMPGRWRVYEARFGRA